MLMTRAAGAEDDGGWRCMSCADECDYQALLQKSWGFLDQHDGVLWQPGDVVVLWGSQEAALQPDDAERFQRFASVIAAEAAAADKAKLETLWPDMPNKARNLPIARDNAATQSKVILRVEAEARPKLARIPAIHVGLADAGGAAGCAHGGGPPYNRSDFRTKAPESS